MSSKYALYVAETGEIKEVRVDSTAIYVAVDPSAPLDDTLHMIVDGALVDRPALDVTETLTIPADGVARVIVTGMPMDTLVRRNGVRLGYATGDLTITPAEVGSHDFDLRPPFPYRRAEFRLEIVEVE
jgi:hypothetical protein